MAKFFFKLQPLLNIKTQLENNAKNELGKAVQKLEEEKDRKKQLENYRQKYIDDFGEKSGKGMRVEKLKEYTAYISHLAHKIEAQNKNIKEASENVDKHREELVAIVKEIKILEKLKEKKYKEYLNELQKDEQKVIDELVSYKYTEKEL
ncbi:MAG: flagellar export protein FliJ [Bacillota bacterium]|nr:flagellar export protein FliJ [Bacillota bacterium]